MHADSYNFHSLTSGALLVIVYLKSVLEISEIYEQPWANGHIVGN